MFYHVEDCKVEVPYDCQNLWRIEDIMADEEDVHQDEDEIPFADEYDGPEEEKEC